MTLAFNPISGVFDITSSSTAPPATGGGYNWVNVTGETQAITAGNGYVAGNISETVFSLPTNDVTIVGQSFKIIGIGGGFTINQAANQQMIYGVDQSTEGTGGSLESVEVYTVIEATCVSIVGTVVWVVYGGQMEVI